jgi:outer membrane scaffolding protein for murein synthesis (MipA/OmpV family)
MKSKKFRLLGILLISATCHFASAAEQVPLWEAGAGVGFLTLPAYRGSDTVHNFVLPVPYFTYHGDFLKADRQGVRGQLFDTDRVELNISTSASPPSKSDDVSARKHMPNLRPTVEIGPELDITLWKSDGRIPFVKLRLPVREAFTVGGTPRDIGAIFSPNLNTDIKDPLGMHGWTFGLLTGPIYATERQNDYFYGVDRQYATAARPAYHANGGYGGWQLLASISKRFNAMWIGAYVREDTLQGAVFDDSPLVVRNHYTSAGIAVSWIFGHSTTMVDAESE